MPVAKRKAQPERALHKAVAEYLDKALPKEAYFFPVPNASKRGLIQAMNMKRAGEFKPGIPDLFVIYRGRTIGIELKSGRNKPTAQQLETHSALMLAGAVVTTIRSLQELYDFLVQLVPLRAKPQ